MKKDKRKMILSAASECFGKFGYKKTTLDDIGRIVGIKKATIYYYFTSKAEIYITMVTNAYRELITKLYNEIEPDMICEEKILAYFGKRLEWLHEQSQILKKITQDELRLFNEYGTDIVNEITKKEKKLFTSILEKCVEEKKIKKIDIEKVSNYIFIMADGIFNFYRSPENPEQITQEEIDMIKLEVFNALKILINGIKLNK